MSIQIRMPVIELKNSILPYDPAPTKSDQNNKTVANKLHPDKDIVNHAGHKHTSFNNKSFLVIQM